MILACWIMQAHLATLQLWGFSVTGRVSNGNGTREEEPVLVEV